MTNFFRNYVKLPILVYNEWISTIWNEWNSSKDKNLFIGKNPPVIQALLMGNVVFISMCSILFSILAVCISLLK